MKKSDHIISALLLPMLLISSVLSACGGGTAETALPEGTLPSETTTEAVTEPPYEFLKTPEDFGGRTFTVLKRETNEPVDLL